MSSCVPRKQLQAMLECRLAADEQARVAEHIDGCSHCQQLLDELTEFQPESGTDTSIIDVCQDEEGLQLLIQRMEHLTPDAAADAAEIDEQSAALPERIGEYEILAPLGSGGTGRLFKAFDRRLQRTVAIKLLRSELLYRPTSRQRFEREARAVAAISHEHIITLHDMSVPAEGPAYLVMEFIDGGSLADRIDDGRPREPREAAEWVRQIALALQAAHESNIVHRDVKPSNLLIDRQTQRLKLSDFGLAREPDSDSRLTQEGMIAGTPAYMSPEQIEDAQLVDHRTDIYSLGVVLYELLTGTVPFRGVMQMVLTQVIRDEPVMPRRLNDHIPHDLQTVCLKAMAKQPGQRYQSSRQFAQDLQRWLEGRPVQARPVGVIGRGYRWALRNRALAALMALVAVLLSTGVAIWVSFTVQLSDERDDAGQIAVTATQQRNTALTALRQVTDSVQQDLSHTGPVVDPQQQVVLSSLLEGLQAVTRSAETHGVADNHTAIAHGQIGRIQLKLGDYEPAETELRLARQMLQSLLDEKPRDPNLLEPLVMALIDLGKLNSELGLHLDALDFLDEAESNCLQLIEQSPQSSLAIQFLATVEVEKAYVDYQIDDLRSAIKKYRSGIERFEQLYAENPENRAVEYELLESLLGLGSALVEDDRIDSAVESLERAVQIGEVARENRSASIDLRLPSIYSTLADAYLRAGRVPEAIESLRLAADAADRNAEADPGDFVVLLESIRLNTHSISLSIAARLPSDSPQLLEAAIERGRNWLASENRDPDIEGAVAEALVLLGRLHMAEGKPEAAREHLEAALELMPKSRAIDDWMDPDAGTRVLLAEAMCRIELAELQLGAAQDAAKKHHQRARKRFNELADYSFIEAVTEYEAVLFFVRFGELSLKLDRVELTVESLQLAQIVLETLEGKDIDDNPSVIARPLLIRIYDGLAAAEEQVGRDRAVRKWKARADRLRTPAASSVRQIR